MTTPAHNFLSQLFGGKPPGAAVAVWVKASKKTHTFDRWENAAEWSVQQAQRCDVYVAAGLAPRMTQPVARRSGNSEVIAIPGVWADIDVNGGPEQKTSAAPSVEAAEALACALLEPTVLVRSGYGVQAWWLLEDLWLFASRDARVRAGQVVQGFQGALKAAAKDRDANWTVDSTHDLARLMRLPGTLNHKDGQNPVPVGLADHDGASHDLDALARIAHPFIDRTSPRYIGSALDVDISVNGADAGHGVPFMLIDELKEVIPEFAARWEHERDVDLSSFEMAIANYLVQASFTDQQIADCLRYHRIRYAKDPDDVAKASRVKYLQDTIAKARAGREVEQRRERRAQQRTEAEQQLEKIADDLADGETPPAPVVTTSLFTKVVGGPPVKELVQDGVDPELARFKLVLADGREVRLGPVSGLLDQGKFRATFATVTRHVVADIKRDKWHRAVQALLTAAQVHEDADNTMVAQVVRWLDGYLERRTSTDVEAACQAGDPFLKDDCVHVCLGSFKQYVVKVQGERIPEQDLRLMLHAAGFERKAINYMPLGGTKRTTRSYYMAPKEVIEGGI